MSGEEPRAQNPKVSQKKMGSLRLFYHGQTKDGRDILHAKISETTALRNTLDLYKYFTNTEPAGRQFLESFVAAVASGSARPKSAVADCSRTH